MMNFPAGLAEVSFHVVKGLVRGPVKVASRR